jgi:hypothetical protein
VKYVRALSAVLAIMALLCSASRIVAATSPQVEPSARSLLQSATDYLQKQPSFAFSAQIVSDDVQRSGLKYKVRAVATFDIQRPGRLFIGYSGDRRKAKFYSDGTKFVFYDQSANVYGTAPATNDNDNTLEAIFTKYDFTVPLLDLVSNHPGASLSGELLRGYDLGASSIGDVATRHLLFTQSAIDWEIWIDSGGVPLIRAFSITYKQLPNQPEYSATLSDWKFTPIDSALFSFTPPPGAFPADLVSLP